jgi:NitT/TauT family transport system permease protein
MKTLVRYLPLLILAVAWEAASRLQFVSSLALPPLSDIILAWWDLLKSGELLTNGAASLWRASAGLFLAIVIGATLGIFMAWWRPVNVVLGPLVEALYPMPKSALIPVTVIWLGFGDGSKILLILLGCMLPVTIGAYNGARGCDQALVWSARSMGASRMRMLWDERNAGIAEWHPHRARSVVHPAGEFRTDRRARRAWLSHRLAGRQRHL